MYYVQAMKKTVLASALGLAFSSSLMAQQSPNYQFVDLGSLGGPEAVAHDINDQGEIVGWSSRDNLKSCINLAGTQINCGYAFVYRDGQMLDLGKGDDASQQTIATAINNQGLIVGHEALEIFGDTMERNFKYNPVMFKQDKFEPLTILSEDANDSAIATDVNDDGVIVGWSKSDTGQDTIVRWQEGKIEALEVHESYFRRANAINNLGDIAGFEYEQWSGKPNRGFVLDQKGYNLIQDNEYLWSEPLAINDYGMMAGASTDRPFSTKKATLWYPSFMGGLTQHLVGGLYQERNEESEFFDINKAGTAVGYSYDGEETILATVYFKGQLYDLNRLVNVEGTLTNANGINEQGDIVGEYQDKDGNPRAFLLKKM